MDAGVIFVGIPECLIAGPQSLSLGVTLYP